MKKLFCKSMMLLVAVVALTACSSDDDNSKWRAYSYTAVNKGLFVLNEGSYFSQINGSLDFLDLVKDEMHRRLFATANGRSLGGTPNNAVVLNGKMYIASADENRVEVIFYPTQVSLASIAIVSPREMATDGRYVYVSSYTGKVTKIDSYTLSVVSVSEAIGANLEGIAVRNGHVYVCNAYAPLAEAPYADYKNEVVKLKASTLEQEARIVVASNPNQIISDGTNLYLASWGDYGATPATVQKVDADDEVIALTRGRMIALSGNKLYIVSTTYDAMWNEVTSYSVYDLTTDTETTFIAGTEIVSPAAIAVDPATKEVFISSYSAGDGGYTSYTTDGYVCRYSATGEYLGRYQTGVGPGTLIFVGE